MKFELPNRTTVKLDNVNPRVERHGEEKVPAIDLALTWTTGNRALDMLTPKLREFLYFTAPGPVSTGKPQGEMDLPVDDLPNIQFAKMAYPVRLDDEFVGWEVRVKWGGNDATDIVLQLCTVKGWKVTPIEGGSCEIKFTVSSSAGIDEHIIGRLGMLQQTEIDVVITAPVVQASEVAPKRKGKLKSAEAQQGIADAMQGLTPEQALINSQAPEAVH